MKKNVRKWFAFAYAKIVNRVKRVGREAICGRLFFSFENILYSVLVCVRSIEQSIIRPGSMMSIVFSDVIKIGIHRVVLLLLLPLPLLLSLCRGVESVRFVCLVLLLQHSREKISANSDLF